jgi:cytochrome b561
VKLAQQVKGDLKGQLMMVHKSTALIVLGLLVPRLALRLATKIPQAVPGPAWEHLLANLNHAALYVLMIFMPVSGVVMGCVW